MVSLANFITPGLTICKSANIATKKQALQEISRLVSAADDRLKASQILEALQQRERLGCTALGHGVAIPHARLDDITSTICVLITLPTAIQYDDDEGHMVDLLFGLLVPQDATQEHLDILAELTNQLKEAHFRELLRSATTDEALYEFAIGKKQHAE